MLDVKKRSGVPLLFYGYQILQALLDLGSLAYTITQIVELSAAHFTLADNLDLLHRGGVQGEHLLYAHAVGHAADGNSLADTAVLLGDNSALEHLDTLTVAFLNTDVNTHGIAHIAGRGLVLLILVAELLN